MSRCDVCGCLIVEPSPEHVLRDGDETQVLCWVCYEDHMNWGRQQAADEAQQRAEEENNGLDNPNKV